LVLFRLFFERRHHYGNHGDGAKNIFIERKGKVQRVPVTFENNEHVMRIIDRIVAPLGRRIDESSPYVDARLQDGSRVMPSFHRFHWWARSDHS